MIFVWFCVGCIAKPPDTAIKIELINHHKTLKISGLNKLIMQDIANDTTNHFESLVPVYRMPADTEMKNYQPIQPGRYQFKNNTLTFTPDTPFLNHQTYFVRYYQYGGDQTIWAFIKGKKSPGKLVFTDLIFKQ